MIHSSKSSVSHVWANGMIVTAELYPDKTINLRIQGTQERMLCDVVMGESEALAVAQSILSVVLHGKGDQTVEPEKPVKVES
jgi:hypothetical protein